VDNNLIQTDGMGRIRKFILDYAVYMLILVVIGVYASLTPLFLSANNIKALLTNSSPLLVAAVGITFVLLIAEIDLSVGSVAGVVGAIWLVLQSRMEVPLLAATLIALTVGAVIGAANGFLVIGLKINSFLATLGMQIFLRGFVYIATQGSQIVLTKEIKSIVSANNLGGISPLVVISILIAAMMMLYFKYSGFGRRVQAVGCNKPAAQLVGISVKKVSFIVFVLCGLFAGIAGMFQVCNVGMVNPSNVGDGLEFLAITAAVLGGTSLLGGTGTFVPGTLVGVIFLMCIENGLGLLGANPYVYPIIRGVVIYLAMFSDSLKRSIGRKS